MKRAKTTRNPLLRFLFLVYMGLLVWLLFYKNRQASYADYWLQVSRNYSIVPFYTIRNYMRVVRFSNNAYLLRHCYVNLVGNVLLFAPGGYLLPALWPKFRKYGKFFFTCLASILAVETVQLFSLLGSFDIDDVILNLVGLTCGYIFYKLTHPKSRKRS